MPLLGARTVPETEPNYDEAREAMTNRYLICCLQSAHFKTETTEQSIAVQEALAFYIGYRVRKTVNLFATSRRQLPKYFYTNPTQAKKREFNSVLSMD